MCEFLTYSAAETFDLGVKLGQALPVPSIVCMFGELGAGKTTFIKGLVSGAAQIDHSIVQSPTFTYLHIYDGLKSIYHFDLYRLRDIDEFLSMGFDEYFDADGICCVEWSERIALYLPSKSVHVNLHHLGGDKRLVKISGDYVQS